MNSVEFLQWVRGPAFDAAVAVFVLGVIFRLLGIILLGRRPDLAEPRGGQWGPGLRTVVSRSLPDRGTFRREPSTVVGGYVFHIGFFITLFLYAPHIELFHDWFGLRWPALATPLVDASAVITLLALAFLLLYRITNPVRRFLSGFGDYFAWGVTSLPVLTGYLAYHHLLLPYHGLLALHILSAELLLIVFLSPLSCTPLPCLSLAGITAPRAGVEESLHECRGVGGDGAEGRGCAARGESGARTARLPGGDRRADCEFLYQLRALRSLRPCLFVLHRDRRSALHSHS